MGDHQHGDVERRRISASSRREAGSRLTTARRAPGSRAPSRARWRPPPGGAGRRRGGAAAGRRSSAMPTCVERRPSPGASSSAPRSPRLAGPNATSSRTVGMKSWSSGSWKTMPTRRRISAQVLLARPAARPTVHRAGAGGEDAVEVQHERGLAGAVRAEQGDPLAAVRRAGRRRTAPGGRRGRRRRARGRRGTGSRSRGDPVRHRRRRARRRAARGVAQPHAVARTRVDQRHRRCSRGDSIARWTRSPRS